MANRGLELGSLITISIYRDFVSLDGESIQSQYDRAHFKLSVELKLFNVYY